MCLLLQLVRVVRNLWCAVSASVVLWVLKQRKCMPLDRWRERASGESVEVCEGEGQGCIVKVPQRECLMKVTEGIEQIC